MRVRGGRVLFCPGLCKIVHFCHRACRAPVLGKVLPICYVDRVSCGFTCLCNDTVPPGLAVIMCEQAEGAAVTTTARLPPVSRAPLPTPFTEKMALATILQAYASKLLEPGGHLRKAAGNQI